MRYQILSLVCLFLCAGQVLADEAAPDESKREISLRQAVEITLQNSPTIAMQRLGVDKAEAGARIASGAFDVNLLAGVSANEINNMVLDVDGLRGSDRPLLPPNAKDVTTDVKSVVATMGAVKLFRTGILADLSLNTRQTDPDIFHPLGLPTNKTSVKFTVTLPLLKGRGETSAAAAENAARLAYEASLSGFQHETSAIVLEAIGAYWKYSGMLWYMDQVKQSEQRVQGWLEGRSDVSLQGYLEDKKGKLIDAQQAVLDAKIGLAKAMGIPANKVDALGMPVENLPLEWDEVLARFEREKAGLLETWVREAEEKRLDLKAVRLTQDGSKTLLDKADQDVLPRLDLSAGVGYNGFSQYGSGFFDSYYDNVTGTDYAVGLTFNYPLGNNLAEGNLALAKADYRQKSLTANEKMRTIHLEVQNEINNMLGRLQKNVQARKTVLSYKQTLQSLLADKTQTQTQPQLIGAMEVENRFLDAQNEGAKALVDLAVAIAKARFTTGTLLNFNETSGEVDLEHLNLLPDF